jgi:hypothetical protein
MEHAMGESRRLNIGGGKPLREGIDTTELARSMHEHARVREQELEAKLAYRREHWIGNFDTGQPCHCGKNIIDHATEHDLNRGRSAFEIRIGPPESIEVRLAQFSAVHRYFCDDCGLKFESTVMEGTRGYIPREKRPEYSG